MRYILEIEVPIAATDPNRSRGKHWSVTKRKNDHVSNWVHFLVGGSRPEKPLEKFKISVTRHASRTMDWDNLVASLKPYIDQLKRNAIIKDDGWAYIKQINTNQVISKERKLVIRVEEVCD